VPLLDRLGRLPFSFGRFFIISERRLRPGAVIPPRFLVGLADEAAALPLFLRRSAHRRFMASDRRLRPAAVIPPPLRAVDLGGLPLLCPVRRSSPQRCDRTIDPIAQ
jgi:hypothetical protein